MEIRPDVTIRANKENYEKHEEVYGMCEAIRELMFEFYGDQLEIDRAKMRKELEVEVRQEVRQEIFQEVCEMMETLSKEATNFDLLMKWKEQFSN